MKIMFCVRFDMMKRFAGDTVQVLKTQKYLKKLGVEVVLNFGDIKEYEGYDIIHIFNITRINESYLHFIRARRTKAILAVAPIFWDLENFYSKSNQVGRLKVWNQNKNLREKILKGSHVIYPNSNQEAVHLNNMFDLEKKCHVIHNGIELSNYEEKLRKNKNVICSGRICRRKNQLVLAEACRKCGFELHLVGHINDKAYFNRCIEKKNVKYLGFYNFNDERTIFEEYKIHALTSYLETPGLVSLEAGEKCCAVVSTDIGCCREYLGDYADYCDHEDVNSISDALSRADKRSENERKTLRQHIRENFSWEKVIEELYKSYTKLI